MRIKKLNKMGASLIEIVATITITSIALLMIYNILSFNIRQNGLNNQKVMNANIGNGVLSYLINQDYNTVENYLVLNTEGYATIDKGECNTIFSEDIATCLAVINPKLNNKVYDETNLLIYIYPFNSIEAYENLIFNEDIPAVFNRYLSTIDTNNLKPLGEFTKETITIISIVVIVKGANEKHDILLRGVISGD